jgi:hypothetical protein
MFHKGGLSGQTLKPFNILDGVPYKAKDDEDFREENILVVSWITDIGNHYKGHEVSIGT